MRRYLFALLLAATAILATLEARRVAGGLESTIDRPTLAGELGEL